MQKEMLRECYMYRETINIPENIPILEYLKENNYQFILQQVTLEEYIKLKDSEGFKDTERRNFIAGYGILKGKSFRSSGGLKVSDPNKVINGSFIVEDNRIIYDPMCAFYEERDSFVYTNGTTFYTTMSFEQILMDLLIKEREYFIYEGILINQQNYVQGGEILNSITKEKFIEYFTKKNKSEKARSNVKTRVKRKNGTIEIIS